MGLALGPFPGGWEGSAFHSCSLPTGLHLWGQLLKAAPALSPSLGQPGPFFILEATPGSLTGAMYFGGTDSE